MKPIWLALMLALGGVVTGNSEMLAEEEDVQLTLSGLYHPDEKVDYEGKEPPAARFLPDESLAIRNDGWQRIVVPAGERTPWQLPQEMRAAVARLDGVDDESLEKVEEQLGDLDDELRFSLIEIGEGLVFYDAKAKTARWITRDASRWQTPTVDPAGKRIAYVRTGDLYVYELANGNTRRLTFDGSDNILNGRLDWVYQEEVYGRGNYKAFWWSPDGQRLAYLRLDQTEVPTFAVLDSRKPEQAVESTRYPLAGDPISAVSLRVADLSSEEQLTVENLTDTSGNLADLPALIVQVGWRDEATLWYSLQNRQQTWLTLYEYVLKSGVRKQLLHETGPWVEVLEPPHWIGDTFLWLSDRSEGRRHLYRVDAAHGQVTPLTVGNWNVWSIEHVDAAKGHAIVIGSFDVGNRVVVNVPFANRVSEHDRGQIVGSDRGWHAVEASPAGTWLLCSHSTIERPTEVALWKGPTETQSAERIEVLHEADAKKLDALKLTEPEVRVFENGEVGLPAIQFNPPDFERTEKWPLIIHTYAGPQAPVATNRWRGVTTLWHHWLAQQGFVVLLVDVRSSAGRGITDTYPIKGRMGFAELEDLKSVLDRLSSETWYDAERVGLWGWSYGGYFTAFAMLHSELFRCGIAGAPVTDWRNYDAIYTERYMDLPGANPDGYSDTTLANRAEQLHGRLLLIHGERDDNVHPANTLQLAAALQHAGQQFDLMIYPGERHSIQEPKARLHLHQMMAEFWQRNLK